MQSLAALYVGDGRMALNNYIFLLFLGDTILGLNGLELNISNVNAMLGAIPGAMEVQYINLTMTT